MRPGWCEAELPLDEAKFYRKGRAGGWREDLTEDEILTVESGAGEIMDALGYERYGKSG